MRRVLLFVALFGAGLAALWWFETQSPATQAGEPAASGPAGASDDSPPGETPAAETSVEAEPALETSTPLIEPGQPIPVPDPQEPRFQIRGKYDFTVFDEQTGKKAYTVQVDDFQPVDDVDQEDVYDANGLTVESFDPTSGALRETVKAVRGRVRVAFGPGERPLLADEGRVELFDVTVTQQVGSPLAPLTIRAPDLEGFLARETFRSRGSGEVVVTGSGLVARGKGLDFDGKTGRIELAQGGSATFQLEGEGELGFETLGGAPLIVERDGDPAAQAFRVSTPGAAKLDGRGDPPSAVQGTGFRVFGRVGENERAEIQRAEITGAVRGDRGADTFTGEEALLLFDPDGVLTSVNVARVPRATFTFVDEAGEPVLLEIEGAGELELDLGQTIAYRLDQGGQLAAPGLGLSVAANESLAGEVPERLTPGGEATFAGRGGVRLEQGERWLETEALDARYTARDVERLTAVTRGATRAEGRDVAGAPVEFEATDGMEFSVAGEEWKVPRARGVTTIFRGADPFRVEAGLILDLDWVQRTFRAEEGVRYASVFGQGRATRAASRGERGIDLQGTADDPVEIQVTIPVGDTPAAGTLRAQRITAREDAFEARDEVLLELFVEDARALVEADLLAVDLGPEADDGTRSFTIRMNGIRRIEGSWALGNVSAAAVDVTIEGVLEEGKRPVPVRFVVTGPVTGQGSANDAQGRAFSAEWDLDGFTLDRGEPDADGLRLVSFQADGVRKLRLAADAELFEISARRVEAQAPFDASHVPLLESAELIAAGEVQFELSQSGGPDEIAGTARIAGVGERLTLSGTGEGRLETDPGLRISTWGRLPRSNLSFEMTADWLRFDTSPYLLAQTPEIVVDATLMPLAPQGSKPSGWTEGRADSLLADENGLRFEGNVLVEGKDDEGRGMSLAARTVELHGDLTQSVGAEGWDGAIDRIEAWGGFTARYEALAYGRGERLSASRERVLMTGEPAQLEIAGFSLESPRIDADVLDFLVATDRGILRAAKGDDSWALEFSAIEAEVSGAEARYVLRGPVYTAGPSGARADWAVLFLDADAWRRRGREQLWESPPNAVPAPPAPPPLPERDLVPNVFRRLATSSLSELVNAAYLEGRAEVTEGGSRAARAERVFLNLQTNSGWLEEAEVAYSLAINRQSVRMRTRSQEMATTSDGALHATKATITACDHDVPHYVVETGNLTLDPHPSGGWRVSASDNMLRFRKSVQIPLPPLKRAALDPSGSFEGFENEKGEVIGIEHLVLSNTPRFGTSLSTVLQADVGSVGRHIGQLFGFGATDLRGHWTYDGAFLGSRGILGGIGLELTERKGDAEESRDDTFWLNMYVSGLSDGGRDRGLVRVLEEDRDSLRLWYRARGRYPIDPHQWVDLAFTSQTDPGIQAEFYEREFVRYEDRDNYLHWRKATGANYFDATAKVRVDDYRTEVEELPSLGAYRGLSEVGQLGSFSLLYGVSLDADYLRRREGELAFEPAFDDGLGDREVVRVDNAHQLQLPIPLGGSGVRATPFLEGRATVWSEDAVEDELPARAGVLGGVELSTTLWRRDGDGFLNEVTPSASWKTDFALEETGGDPVRFDPLDDALDGTEIDLGVRTRWWKTGELNRLDLELRNVHRYDRQAKPDLERIQALGELRTHWGTVPVAIQHDGRYDLDTSDTTFSRSVFAMSPREGFIFQLGYNRGLDEIGDRLYEAASVAARLRATPKWELEVRETISVTGDEELNNQFTLRRFSHDFLLEIQVGTRSGEGGTSFSIRFNPLLIWRPSRLGILDDRY